ncbi:MAG: Slp family lipoprotein [Burkholderiales bacterium]
MRKVKKTKGFSSGAPGREVCPLMRYKYDTLPVPAIPAARQLSRIRMVYRDMKRFWIIGLLAWPWSVLADPAYTRDQTLEQDLHGPRVEWAGEIVVRIPDGDYTCFLLQRPYYGQPQSLFIACNPGAFEASTYFAGRALHVTGNLGPALPRKIGGQVYEYPLVAGAFVELLPPQYYSAGYFYSYYPFYHHRFHRHGYHW